MEQGSYTLDGEKNHLLSAKDTWRRIEEAYSYGVDLSRKKKVP
jgi:hypothetical protein